MDIPDGRPFRPAATASNRTGRTNRIGSTRHPAPMRSGVQRLVVRTAATVSGRIGAGAAFHGGGLVTDKPDSLHLLAPRIRARMLFAIARSDDEKRPEAKDKLRQSFADAKAPATVGVFAEKHGWCVPDMPKDGGVPIYDKAAAERAWGELLALYKNALA